MWTQSVFEYYLGSFQRIDEKLPKDLIALSATSTTVGTNKDISETNWGIWTTALAIKILEVKMMEKKDTWELVADKGKYFLRQQCKNNEDMFLKLLQEAESLIKEGKYRFE